MPLQSKAQQYSSAARMSLSKLANGKRSSNNLPLTYGNLLQRVIKVFQPRMFRCVQNVEQLRQLRRQVAAVFAGLLTDEFGELRALENAGVLGKQAKQQAHQIDFQVARFCLAITDLF